jgi:hypothetical protein
VVIARKEKKGVNQKRGERREGELYCFLQTKICILFFLLREIENNIPTCDEIRVSG